MRGPGHRLIEKVDALRIQTFEKCAPEQRKLLGQFHTPVRLASFMASLFEAPRTSIRLLDAGAGVGSLTAAFIASICERSPRPANIVATAFEVDSNIAQSLRDTLTLCERVCHEIGVKFDGRAGQDDFIRAAVDLLDHGLFDGGAAPCFNCAILNPPYKKISTDSEHRRLLRKVGLETTNLYTAFVGLAVLLLEPEGELVAITPRSFCNGPYFRPFRELFLREMSLRRIHVFESRSQPFAEDEILQENVVIHAVKSKQRPTTIVVSSSLGPGETPILRRVKFEDLVKLDDPQKFIHIVVNESGGRASELMGRLNHSLEELGLSVSTGRVVDFRSRSLLRSDPGSDTVPLIYPTHFSGGWIAWPKLRHKKPNACVRNDASARWLIPAAVHVLVKRFSAKEEKRRVVASVFDPRHVPCEQVAFENHLNYYHENGRGLSLSLAKGLTAFLNSTVVDTYFRQFNGHTQVNATDLRSLRYPARGRLEDLGEMIGDTFPDQAQLDLLIGTELIGA
jgi:adenine-specific DNA-methyltransferase